MTRNEMHRRMDAMTIALIDQVKLMLDQGYSDRAIVRESPATLKQVNAVICSRSRFS